MELINIMQHRRSVRKYTDEPVAREQLDMILKAGLLSASGKAVRPWQFIVVTDRNVLRKMSVSRATGSAGMLAGASAAIVVVGDPEMSDMWVEDCSIAMANMHLMADALGIGSCWIQGRARMADETVTTDEYMRKLLGYPENLTLEATLSLGIPSVHAAPYRDEDLHTEKIHWETY